jgi:hypothetical protein
MGKSIEYNLNFIYHTLTKHFYSILNFFNFRGKDKFFISEIELSEDVHACNLIYLMPLPI